MDKIELDENGYCIDCKIYHNCNNCDRMEIFLNISKKVKSNSDKIVKGIACGCGNNKNKGSIMCQECFFKYKLNNNF